MTPDTINKGFLWGYGDGSIDDSKRLLIDRYFVRLLKERNCQEIFCFPTPDAHKIILCPPIFHRQYYKNLMKSKPAGCSPSDWELLYFRSGKQVSIASNGRCNISFIFTNFACHLISKIKFVGHGFWIEAWDSLEWKKTFKSILTKYDRR